MNILFIGPPGSGKGTQSKLLNEKMGITHLSTGDMFRKAIADKTEVGMQAKSFMDRGEYVPDSVVIEMIKNRLNESDCNSGFILDGFPRTVPQAQVLESVLNDLDKKLDRIIFFDVEKNVLVQRLSSRRTCKLCGRIISADQIGSSQGLLLCSSNPKEPCNFYQRDDDRAEVVEKRIEVYQQQTTPVILFYQKKENFLRVDGNLSPDKVYKLIENFNHQNS